MKGQYYDIVDISDIDMLKTQLKQIFVVIDETEASTAFQVLDTFDWRLFLKGWQLIKVGRHLEITESGTEMMIGNSAVQNDKPKKFWWDFHDSAFSNLLQPVLKMRALLPIAEIVKKTIQLNLCNKDEKIVVRLHIESFSNANGENALFRCRTIPVRGYQKEYKQVRSSIEALAFPVAKTSPVFRLIERSGVKPGGYSSKINLSLAPALPAAEAVRRIMQTLVEVIHLNLPGVREDIDSEFLHDFRVSVRRSRSLLSQLKGVLDADTTALLQTHLKSMGAMTGDVRDLDVYLLKESDYISRIPEVLRPGLVPFFQTLKRRRRYAKDRMIKAMDGEEFAFAMKSLDDFIQSDPMKTADAPNSTKPILEIAKSVIYKRYRRIVKKGRKIKQTTPDEKLHALRIDCKKLRYLLEFFTSLFPENEMKKLVKQLKELQENLGDFNDLSVQQKFLANHLGQLTQQTKQVVILSAAIGGLIARLDTAHKNVRSQFLTVFESFNSPDTQKRFRTLFDE
jgi:CHAD domain-containing protein